MKALLTSWKDIADYLGRTPRTVQRWERKFQLPVHRPLHHQSGVVAADTDELDNWILTSQNIGVKKPVSNQTPAGNTPGDSILLSLARKEPCAETLEQISAFVRRNLNCDFTQISLYDKNARRLRSVAGSNLPGSFQSEWSINIVAPGYGSCGVSAHLGAQIISVCIRSDPKWIHSRRVAVAHGVTSCWSQPVFSNDKQVLGVVGAYFKRPKRPTADYLSVLELAAQVVSVTLQFDGFGEPLDQFDRNACKISVDRALTITSLSSDAGQRFGWQKKVVGTNLLGLFPSSNNPTLQGECVRALAADVAILIEEIITDHGVPLRAVVKHTKEGLELSFAEGVHKMTHWAA